MTAYPAQSGNRRNRFDRFCQRTCDKTAHLSAAFLGIELLSERFPPFQISGTAFKRLPVHLDAQEVSRFPFLIRKECFSDRLKMLLKTFACRFK